MRRRAKSTKAKVKAKPPVARNSRKNEGSKGRDLEKRLAEALDQQTATSDILRVISSSRTDVQPVFESLVASAARLCGANDLSLLIREADVLRPVAGVGSFWQSLKIDFRVPLVRGTIAARSVIDGATLHFADLAALSETEFPVGRDLQRRFGHHTVLAVPLMREGVALGTIFAMRFEVRPFEDQQVALLKTFADQAVIAIENVRLFKELEQKNQALTDAHAQVTESLEQQTATTEILRVISSSPTDVQPVFDAIVASATRLCEADLSGLYQFDGTLIHFSAQHGRTPEEIEAAQRAFPQPLGRASVSARAILEATVVQVSDVREDPEMASSLRALFRTVMAIPMLRDGRPIGSITVARRVVRLFSDEQIALLQTFADQAVIAIENVRLFKELEARNRDLTESLEQQTATAEILRVISQSPTDLQPVLDAIAASAARLCDSVDAQIFRIDGEVLRIGASYGALPKTTPADSRPIDRSSVNGRAVVERRTIHLHDLAAESDTEWPVAKAYQKRFGHRTIVATPLLREGVPLGAITIRRMEVRPFSDTQIALLETFADQAVIAIENVRLFNELEGRNRDLTATSEILRVISSSPTDVQPVFDTIVRSAVRLCNGLFGTLLRFDGELIHQVAQHNYSPEGLEELHRIFPTRPSRALGSGRAILERTVDHIPDIEVDPESRLLTLSRAVGFRSGLSVPMLREGTPIGAIVVNRAEPGPFSDSEIELLKTFADQAVIAVENVRLFTELQASNRELTTALDQQTATSDILSVISRSQTDVQPVFDAIVASAVRLLGAYTGSLTRIVGDQIELAAFTSTDAAGDAGLRAIYPQSVHSEQPHAQVIRARAPFNITDTQTDPRVPETVHASARARGFRGAVGVPLLRHGVAVGVIGVTRREAAGFTDDEIALLKTFADQAVIAIENVRLFTELEGRNRDVTEALEQQTATSEVLKVISRSTFELQPVLETLVENAARLCGADWGVIYRLDGEMLHVAAFYLASPEFREFWQEGELVQGRGSCAGRAALERRTIQIADALADPEYELTDAQERGGYRTLLSVPMLKESALIGVFTMMRAQVRPFNDKQIELVTTFANQAVIAIENVRLLQELQARTSELARSVEELKALGEVSRAVGSTLDLEIVLNTIVTRAVRLSNANGGTIYEYNEATQQFDRISGAFNLDDDLRQVLLAAPIRLGEGATGTAAARQAPVQVADVLAEGAYDVTRIRAIFERRGYRSLLAAPLLFERQIVGVLVVWGREPGTFPQQIVDLLQTLATQSVLAIQNARLFHEIADKSAQLEAASRHKSEFLANMSHELRTPLNAIIGFSEVLTERMFGELNEKQDEYLKDIYASGQHLLSLINDILDLSKIEAGRMELELADFDLPSAIDNALILVRERASRRGITLGHSVDERLGSIRGDERKVKQVLLNLLSNALKFTPEGGRIDVRAVPQDGVAEISVTDTGVGIAPEDQQAVFEEFRQVGTADKKVEGTGLGLALSRKFIELHGGRIWVESEEGKGSTFTFSLPVGHGA